MKTIARPFRLARFSAAWTDAPFYYLPVGDDGEPIVEVC